jgi:hypothetical protein
MEKVNFRIKLNKDKRAVSYRNIEVENNNGVTYVTFNGGKTMVRQYLNSIYKKYKFKPKFKKEYGNALVVRFDTMPEDIYKDLSQKLTQFARGYMFKSNNTNLYDISFKVELLGVRVDNFTTATSSAPATTSTPIPSLQSNGLYKLRQIRVLTNEGSPNLKDKIFTKWSDFQNALQEIYDNDEAQAYDGGYSKVFFDIYWENDEYFRNSISVGKSGFNPSIEFIGDFLKEFGNPSLPLSWTDEETESPQQQPEQQQPEQEPMETNKLPLSYIEVYDINKKKLLKRFTNWTDADNYFESIWLKLKPKTFKDYVVEIDWGSTQVRANTSIRLDAEEYYPDGNDGFYDRFLVNEFYNYKDTDKWKNVRDTLQWNDSDETPNETPQPQPQQQEQQPQMPPNTSNTMNTNYILTESEMETIYGVDWRKLEKLDWIDELDYKLGTILNQNQENQLINYGNLIVEIDGLDYTIYVEATTLACYKDYNDLSAQEIDEIIDGLKIYLEIGVGVSEERKNAYELMENLKLFKQHNK